MDGFTPGSAKKAAAPIKFHNKASTPITQNQIGNLGSLPPLTSEGVGADELDVI
jgi:hypothetical protein